MKFKKWHHSKTIWLNFIALAIYGINSAAKILPVVETNGILGLIMPITNIILRHITKEKIS